MAAGCGQVAVRQPAVVEQNNPVAAHVYTNDIYKYSFNYPDGAVIKEAGKDLFSMSPEEYKSGVTFDDIYNKYTGKVCLDVQYNGGHVYISAPANKDSRYVLCSARTGIGSEATMTSAKEDFTIDGKVYTAEAQDIAENGTHNYIVRINLPDATRITISAYSPENKNELKKIVESYVQAAN